MKIFTKRDLLDSLAAFDDSIKIVVEEDMGCLDWPNPAYHTGGRGDYLTEYESEKGIEKGEGYIVL